MPRSLSIRLQTAIVIFLFLGSLAIVLLSAFQTLRLPHREIEGRDRLREASRRMAEAARSELASLPPDNGRPSDGLTERLRAISGRVLTDFPGVEGGFYLGGDLNRFVGFAFPTNESIPPPPASHRLADGANAPTPTTPQGDDPPPKEKPYILIQAQNSVSLDPGEFLYDVRTIGPSRVAILTEPVGATRPARLATWTMFRLVSPESQESQLRRYQVSTALALGGIALAVVLTINLGRTLRRQWLEQEQLRDELRRSEHLAALGKLLAGVAHEVRNPLAGIRSTVQLWERLPETTRSEDSLQAVIHAVDRLNEIVSRLLYFARVDNAERQPVLVNSVLTDTLNLMEAQAKSQSVVIERDLDPKLPSVLGAANALRQVFLNLATNALQAMPQGGRLTCGTRLVREKKEVEIRFTDSGPGITPDDRKHLFEPFFTTRPEGTGLGLALCREIILQHGGQIEFDAGGPGTTFRVVLPATAV